MKENPQVTTQMERDFILARHNEQSRDVNPDFIEHCVFVKGREILVDFYYQFHTTTFDGRKWS